jgi:nicotinamide-nucleotide amidase
MDHIKAEIISIGNEILAGWTLNTNAHWIAQKLNDIGLPVQWISTIADTENEITAALKTAGARANVILCTGGLGPTPDDITKMAISKAFKTKLVLNKDILKHIQEIFNKRHLKMSKTNRQQALVPESASTIHNSLGTAPGLIFEENGQLYFFMPGVPREMKKMMTTNILTHIKNYFQLSTLNTYILRTTGIAESRLFEKIERILQKYEDITVSFLPKITGVDIKLKIPEQPVENHRKAKQLLDETRKIIGKYIYTETEEELQEILGKHLRSQNLSIAVAESFTGGLISDWLTDIPGSSDYFLGSVISYSNNSKIRELGVAEKTLTDFGAVSEQTALEMALGVQHLFQADCAIASTGIAGPGGATENKAIGLCYLAVLKGEQTFAKKFNFGENRRINKERGAMAGLESLRRLILDL